MVRADWTYSDCLATSTSLRISRVYSFHPTIHMAMSRFRVPGPRMATMAMTMIKNGKAMNTSSTRMMMASTLPP